MKKNSFLAEVTFNFFNAVSLIENNSGKTSSSVKGVLNGLMVKVLDSESRGPMFKNKVDSGAPSRAQPFILLRSIK